MDLIRFVSACGDRVAYGELRCLSNARETILIDTEVAHAARRFPALEDGTNRLAMAWSREFTGAGCANYRSRIYNVCVGGTRPLSV